MDQETRRGRRVLLLARTEGAPSGDGAPAGQPVALVVIEERIRENARSTLDYFASQDVTVKVVSGDDPRTVGAEMWSASQPQIGRLTTPATWYTASAAPAATSPNPARLVRCTVMN